MSWYYAIVKPTKDSKSHGLREMFTNKEETEYHGMSLEDEITGRSIYELKLKIVQAHRAILDLKKIIGHNDFIKQNLLQLGRYFKDVKLHQLGKYNVLIEDEITYADWMIKFDEIDEFTEITEEDD